MVLESTIICVDNSEFMRNGDFIPSRLHAQQDAVQLVCNAKTRSNPENNIALMSMAAEEHPKVYSTFTTDVNRIISHLSQIQPDGDFKFLTGIKIAQIVLRNRQGKNHRQRIVVFVGSPVLECDKEIVTLAKKLKKNNVNVNVVNFGEEDNCEKLQNFISTLNQGKDEPGSHFVNVPSGSKLSEALMQSPVICEDGGLATGGAFDPSGFDPNEDPELALALRVSMEEQRNAQQEEERSQPMETGTAASETPAVAPSGPAQATEDALLQQALSLSMGGVAIQKDLSQMTEDEQIELALRMSMQQESASSEAADTVADSAEPMETTADDEGNQEEVDAETLQAILASLPGMNPDDPQVNEMFEQQKKEEEEKKKSNQDGQN